MHINRNTQIAIGVILVVVILLGGYFLIAGKSKKPVTTDKTTTLETIQTLTAKDIGLSISASSDKKKVKFSIAKANDIKTISYELKYEADSTAEEQSQGSDPRVDRGITGDVKVDAGKSTYESPMLDLGSCSKNVCKYDNGISSVDLTLKIVKNDGKTYMVEQKQDL